MSNKHVTIAASGGPPKESSLAIRNDVEDARGVELRDELVQTRAWSSFLDERLVVAREVPDRAEIRAALRVLRAAKRNEAVYFSGQDAVLKIKTERAQCSAGYV